MGLLDRGCCVRTLSNRQPCLVSMICVGYEEKSIGWMDGGCRVRVLSKQPQELTSGYNNARRR
jgi:hypothetical protein